MFYENKLIFYFICQIQDELLIWYLKDYSVAAVENAEDIRQKKTKWGVNTPSKWEMTDRNKRKRWWTPEKQPYSER